MIIMCAILTTSQSDLYHILVSDICSCFFLLCLSGLITSYYICFESVFLLMSLVYYSCAVHFVAVPGVGLKDHHY